MQPLCPYAKDDKPYPMAEPTVETGERFYELQVRVVENVVDAETKAQICQTYGFDMAALTAEPLTLPLYLFQMAALLFPDVQFERTADVRQPDVLRAIQSFRKALSGTNEKPST